MVNVSFMIVYGVEQMNNFHHQSHDEERVDKLRSLCMTDTGHIDTGARNPIVAATPSLSWSNFKLSLDCSGRKLMCADYDAVIAFFEDVNGFLQQIFILEMMLTNGVCARETRKLQDLEARRCEFRAYQMDCRPKTTMHPECSSCQHRTY